MGEVADGRAGTPDVSVVIPTYNRARWLPQAVESALNQTLAPLEVVVVDDGSTDETEAVCGSLPETVRYIRQERAGAGAARNRGAAEAEGEWLAFLDSDDMWTTDKLEVQLAALAATGAVWSITNACFIDPEGRPLSGVQGFERAFPVFNDLDTEPAEFFERHFQCSEVEVAGTRHTVYSGNANLSLFYGNYASPATAVVRRTLFERAGGFDERLRTAEDTEFFHRLAPEGPVAIVDSALLQWRVGHGTSLVASDVEGSIRTALRSLEQAAARSEPLSADARTALFRGRQALLLRLAYWQLTELEGAAVRDTLRELRQWEKRAFSVPRLSLWAASLLPRPFLHWAGRIKRRLGI